MNQSMKWKLLSSDQPSPLNRFQPLKHNIHEHHPTLPPLSHLEPLAVEPNWCLGCAFASCDLVDVWDLNPVIFRRCAEEMKSEFDSVDYFWGKSIGQCSCKCLIKCDQRGGTC